MSFDHIIPWRLRRYLFALLLVAGSSALRVWPLQPLGSKVAYLTFYPVVMIAAIYGGLSAGLLATGSACLVVIFGGPVLVGQPFIATPADWLGVTVFVLTCSMMSGVAEGMRRANARAKRAQDQAEAANRAKSAFLASMSHELRTPLNAILGFSDILRTDTAIPVEQRRSLDIINHSGEHLLTLINDVLDMAKVEAGGLVADHDAFDLGQMILDVLDMLRVRAEQKGLQLLLDCSSELPRVVRGDAARLRQVLINLIGNAIKYTDEGTVTVRMHAGLSGDSERPLLTIEVEDTGPGIAAADQHRVFDPFVQLDTGVVQQGTGLGLAITREYVELMSGAITIESEPGDGSIFRVELPVERAALADLDAAVLDRGRVIGLSPGVSVPRVLIVEDQVENWLLLKRLLEGAGVEVRVAENGQLGFEAFAQWGPDLIFMDIRMPVMDGIAATRMIRDSQGGRDVKIVALTASVFREEQSAVIDAGMDDFVSKPYRAHDVFESMERQLGTQFEYEAPIATDSATDELRPVDVAALPQDLRDRLIGALVSLDAARIDEAVRHVRDRDSELGATLAAHVSDLDYTKVLKALHAEDER